MKKIIMMLTIIFIFLGYNNTFAEPINKGEIKTEEFTFDRDDYYKLVNEKDNEISKTLTYFNEGAISEKIYNGLKNLEKTIDLSSYYKGCSIYNTDDLNKINALGELYFDVLYEKPEIFYSANDVTWSYSYYAGSGEIVSLSLNIKYIYDNDIILKMKNELDNKVKEIKDKYLSGITDKLQLEYIIHDYILNNTEYDYGNYINGTVPNISHSSYASLINGKAVCDGYSKAAKLLFDEVGIESGIIISEEMNHSWNYVNIDNKYYHLDITWDDPAPETNRIIYSYFNLSDTEMAKDHIWVSGVYPQCNNKEFSFLRNINVDSIARINNKIYTLNNGKLQYSNLYGNNKTTEKDNIYGKYLTSYKNNLIFIDENSYDGNVVKYNVDNKTIKIIHDMADYIYVKENSLYAKNGTSIIAISLQEKEDFNDDGTVDIKDLAELSLKYGQTNSSSKWNYKYDLNNDGIIDIYDLILVSKLI